MHVQRARFKKEILAEFVPPFRKSNRVVIFCGGLPSIPYKKDVLFHWAKAGYWAIFPRYRGTWESGGQFLSSPPEKDVLDIVDQLPKGFVDIWSGQEYVVAPESVYVIGSSFGGAVALMSSFDERIDKAVALSPVVDWLRPGPDEPMDKFHQYLTKGFGEVYRFSNADWNKLEQGKILNPASHIEKLDSSKILFLQAEDDRVIDLRAAKEFVSKTGADSKFYKRGGHFSLSDSIRPLVYKKIIEFFKT